MQKILTKIFGIFLLFIFLGIGFIFLFNNEPLPKVAPSREADVLAHKMLSALGEDAYKDTRYLEWSFRGGDHSYVWDKQQGSVEIRWDTYEVTLKLYDLSKSKVLNKGEEVTGAEKASLIKKASGYFNNDSFWLVAPFKVFDEGTTRALVPLPDGSDGLLVTYSEGGDTPGDSYLWLLDESGIPEAFKMWVKILPLKGQKASWEGWHRTDTGVLLPQTHRIGPIALDLGTVKTYN